MTNKEKLDELFDLYSKGLISKIDLANSIKAINETEQKDTIEIDEDILNNDLYKTDEARKLAQESRNKAKELKERQAQRDADRLENEAKVKHEEELKAIHKELSDDRNIMIDILSSLKNRVTDEPIYSLRSLQHMPIKELLKLYNDMEFNAPSTLKQAIDKLGYTEWAEKKLAKENDEVSENSMNDEAVSKKSEEFDAEKYKKVQDAISDQQNSNGTPSYDDTKNALGDQQDNTSVDALVKGVQGAVEDTLKKQRNEREVIADPNNSKPAEAADSTQPDSDEVDITPEMAEEESVEPKKDEQAKESEDNPEDKKQEEDTSEVQPDMDVRGPKIRETVSKIKAALDGKNSALLGKIQVTAALAIAAVVAIPVVAPLVSSVGTVAAAGLAIDGFHNFNKGRNGKL